MARFRKDRGVAALSVGRGNDIDFPFPFLIVAGSTAGASTGLTSLTVSAAVALLTLSFYGTWCKISTFFLIFL